MKPQISIIVLIYNKENYLKKCLDSIINQTYSDFEVLLIDDGSTDNSGQICDDYEKRDGRFKVFHKENGGVSDARNFGMKHSSGEYITFVDADDHLSPDFLQNFNPSLGADLYVQAVTVVENSTECGSSFEYMELNNESSISDFFRKTLPYTPAGYALRLSTSKLYKKSILEGLYFDKDVLLIEDYLFNMKFYQKIKSLVVVTGTGYYYNTDNSILSKRKYPVDKFIDWQLQLHTEIYKLSKLWNCTDMFEEIVRLRFRHIFGTTLKNNRYSSNDRYKIYNFMSNYLKKEECKSVTLDKSTNLIRLLPTSYLSFLIIELYKVSH